MMRSLWTAASGMIGEQSNLDVIANNLSNINTTGYKTQKANFKSLIYQNLQVNDNDRRTKAGRGTGWPWCPCWFNFFRFYTGTFKCLEWCL